MCVFWPAVHLPAHARFAYCTGIFPAPASIATTAAYGTMIATIEMATIGESVPDAQRPHAVHDVGRESAPRFR